MKKTVQLFVPLMKVDVEHRLLIGTMTQEVEDRMGETMDYDTSKAYFQKWSDAVSKASGGKSVGNLRIMHGLAVAGIVKSMEFDDENKAINIVAEVVDEDTWQMVLKGGYTGFSIGGRYVKKFKRAGMQMFTVDPFEVSVVDLPCVPTATFEVIKADGATESVTFKPWEPDNADIVAKATELATAAGGAWNTFVPEARDLLIKARADSEEDDGEPEVVEEETPTEEVIKVDGEGMTKTDDADADDVAAKTDAETPADESKEQGDEEAADEAAKTESAAPVVSEAKQKLAQVWKTTDGQTFEKAADAVSHQERVDLAAVTDPLTKAIAGAQAALTGEASDDKEHPLAKTVADLTLWKGHHSLVNEKHGEHCVAKSLYAVGRLAEMMDGFSCIIRSQLWERADELANGTEMGDGSVINDIYSALTIMGGALVKMAQEEIAEMMAELTVRGVPIDVGMPDEVVALAVQDQVKKSLGRQDAVVRKVHSTDTILELLKGLGLKIEDTEEVASIKNENTLLKTTISETTETVNKMKADIEAIKATAMPSKAIKTTIVGKEQDVGNGGDATKTNANSLDEFVKNATPDQLAQAAIKIAQQNPQRLGTASR